MCDGGGRVRVIMIVSFCGLLLSEHGVGMAHAASGESIDAPRMSAMFSMRNYCQHTIEGESQL